MTVCQEKVEALIQVRVALQSYYSKEEGFQLVVADALRKISHAHFFTEFPPVETEEPIFDLIQLCADALSDTSRGAIHPLTEPADVRNRRPDDTPALWARFMVTATTGAYVSLARRKNEKSEVGFREAARKINSYGAAISWKTARSAWYNRKRLPSKYHPMLDAFLASFHHPDAVSFDHADIARDYAENAARALNQKT